ncbi:protein GRAVITROPIC IN THE LIGHT 1 [Senna tora]|uniref:Protein GRAVITROPIC IN THE LIGHT 1 n=1 Tax=Senna tora TaxID=362788 RepID=A0A834T6Q5_9FABA|nr:protein GRAVITROPIC IN THE LIGHT 1 [Senna tora]
MTRKVSNFSDLIQRVTASCLLHPLADGRYDSSGDKDDRYYDESEPNKDAGGEYGDGDDSSGEDEENDGIDDYDEDKTVALKAKGESKKVKQMEALMEEVFEAVSAMKRAYVSLQAAHCPWDPEKMRVADVAVVAEMRRLGVLRERFRRRRRADGESGGGGRRRLGRRRATASVREVVAPYEAVVEELKKEVKAKDLEVNNLKEKLENVVAVSSNGRKLREKFLESNIKTFRLSFVCFVQARIFSKVTSFFFLKVDQNGGMDPLNNVATATSASSATDPYNPSAITVATSIVSAHHAKYALESYISRKIFQGFDHETFYMDGSLSSLLNPDQFRRDCFTQYHDMKSMDPTELLGILPSCHFGKFCSKKYLAIVHPKMEESLFGNLDQHRQVSNGSHPRSQFYNEFLGVAKAVWLLHLLAFSLNPAPSQFEASRGAEFHPQYMESVVKFNGGRVAAGQVVGFPVSLGFKLGNGSVVKARVYLIARA